MASENTYEIKQNEYVAFDAISLRNLILERLNKQGTFTDHNYIGSNLASVIDIISYAYNTLIFYLNQTSNESNFTEAQIYENIARIVSLLDYKPVGYQTSTLAFQASAVFTNETRNTFDDGIDLAYGRAYTIPRYSQLIVDGVPFSFNEDVTFSGYQEGTNALEDLSNRKLLYQGLYKETPVYTAQGDKHEIVTISNPNSTSKIDHFNIDVYVWERTRSKWYKYNKVTNLYTEQAFSRACEIKLSPQKEYEITFGDSINGRQLQQGDQVVIYYLESSGEAGVVSSRTLPTAGKVIFSALKYSEILNSTNSENFNYINNAKFNSLSFDNFVSSTLPKDIETAESIKKNAPSNFKSQYRLVTKGDYESFVRTNFANFISDVKVLSNWDYTSKYLKYFHDILVSPTAFRQVLLNNVLYSDSCNFNNIYICAIPKISPGSTLKYLLPAQKEVILTNTNAIKSLTTEIVFVDPIYKAVSFGVKTNSEPTVESKEFCRLELIKTKQSKRSARSIASDARRVIADMFDPTKTTLGKQIPLAETTNNLLAIDGVHSIRMRRIDTNETFNGLSLLVWNPNYADYDKQVITTNLSTNEFDFVYFDNLSTVFSKIDVIEPTSFTQ